MAGTITIKGGLNSVIQNDENDNLIVTTNNASKQIYFQGTSSADSPFYIDEAGNSIFQDTGSGQSVSLTVSSSTYGGYQVMFKSGSDWKSNSIRFIQDISGSGTNQSRALISLSGSSHNNTGVNMLGPYSQRLSRAYGEMFVTTGAGGLAVTHYGVSPYSHSFFIGNHLTHQGAYDSATFEVQDDSYSSWANPNIIHRIPTQMTQITASGNISSSGTITMLSASIGGGIFTSSSLAGGGGGGTPGGSTTQVQFNDGGSFGGDSDLVWNKTTNALTINGTLNATRKSFVVNHQKINDHNLVHGSLEGPEFGVYIRGKVENDNKIALPDYWEWLVDEDSISVHITPIGYHILPLYFKEIKDNYVYVNKKTNFYYYICAERKDIEKLKIIEKK